MSFHSPSADGEQPVEDEATGTAPSRRTFLAGAGAAALTGLAAACAPEAAPETIEDASEVTQDPPTPAPVEEARANAAAASTVAAVPFAGAHQSGILQAPTSAGLVASFDVLASDRSELATTMQVLSAEVERIMSGRPSESEDSFLPPVDSGAVGAESSTNGTAITVAVGASLFDGRFGLTEMQPRELIAMPRFFNDRLVQPELSHGDIALTITGPNQQAVVFALHQAVRVTERRLQLKWVQEGYNQLLPPDPDQVAPTRNLMGFRDGTSNLDTTDADVMAEHVWVGADDADEPAWAVGGTYQATRIIRMLIEFWATAALVRQEQIFGRHRDTGAPMGQTAEAEEPTFASDPNDETIPRRSHMRLANPRTPGTGRILRRGFSYLNGVDPAGALDQGLLFSCYQRSLTRGFLNVQSRLDGEPLEDYIKPVGGGLFFVLPGPGDSGGWLGQSLLG